MNRPGMDFIYLIRSRFKRLFKRHFFLTLGLFLIGSWFGIAWLEYQAEKGAQGANIANYEDGVWWGIVTMLTIGYGDRFPVTPSGRLVAGLLMLCGVLVIGILTAKISSFFLEDALREGKENVETERLKNHFIVCGWKENMTDLLIQILDFNPNLSADQLVLIANIPPSEVQAIKENRRLLDLQFIIGEPFHENNLKKATPQSARKILILADQSATLHSLANTTTEIDAKTIMTAMTLSKVCRGTLIAAEILDPSMDQYLKLAHVTEVIYSQEYSRLLIGNSSAGTGVVNILFDLLDPKTGVRITTHPLPTGPQTYGELKVHAQFNDGQNLLVGLLENSGNTHQIKDYALKMAQKTPNVEQLVKNLRAVKEVKCNQPVFNPPNDYAIQANTLAIVIHTPDALALTPTSPLQGESHASTLSSRSRTERTKNAA